MFAAGIVFLSSAKPVNAQSIFEKLVMPGALSKVHKGLEKNCSNCHRSFKKSSQKKLCLSCHKSIMRDLERNRGFHGKRQDVKTNECKHCHTDHKGPDEKIAPLDAEIFDHSDTDFKLNGAHTGVECDQCHKKKTKFRDTSAQCIDCHEKRDRHKSNLGEDCSLCHVEKNWRETKPFDHENTNFALVGAHKKAVCTTCHIDEVYEGLPATCSSCHKADDVHKGTRGKKCETCHVPKEWKEVIFDHSKDTSFPLLGLHQKVTCKTCHVDGVFKKKKTSTCSTCHKKNDPHKGQLGKNCANCHTENGWRKEILFDHDITAFPLIGLHAGVPCEACHATRQYKDTSINCVNCHKSKDVHKGNLGRDCSTCHTPNSWSRWRFNHARQTRFPLTGRHKGLVCSSCHDGKQPVLSKTPGQCISCHKKDDVHKGAYGNQCEKCHSSDDFSTALIK